MARSDDSRGPAAFAAGDVVPNWLFQVRPEGCYARFLQPVVVAPVGADDHEFVISGVDPHLGGYLVEVVSDGRAVQMTAAGRGVRVVGRAELTRGAASHLNRKTRRQQVARARGRR